MKPIENTKKTENTQNDSASDKIYSEDPGNLKRPSFDGEKLVQLRLEADFSLRKLAQIIETEHNYPITFQYLGQIELGLRKRIDPYLIILLAKIFGVEESYFYEE